MALSISRRIKIIIAVVVGLMVLATAAGAASYALISDKADNSPKAAASTSRSTPKKTPTKAKTPTATPSTTTPTPEPVNCAEVKCVALTFDDGPGADTPQLLDILKAEKVRVTFLLVGKSVATYPDTVAREVAEGHSIGAHTWSHPELTKLSDAGIVNEVNATVEAISKAAPNAKVTFTRPPYGAFNSRVISVLQSLQHAALLWNVDTLDWKNRDPNTVLQQVKEQVKPGSIILMHDIHPTTIQAVPEIIKYLHSEGFTLVTVPEMFGGSLTPGKVYFDQNLIQ